MDVLIVNLMLMLEQTNILFNPFLKYLLYYLERVGLDNGRSKGLLCLVMVVEAVIGELLT